MLEGRQPWICPPSGSPWSLLLVLIIFLLLILILIRILSEAHEAQENAADPNREGEVMDEEKEEASEAERGWAEAAAARG